MKFNAVSSNFIKFNQIAKFPERLKELKSMMRALGFSDAKMEELQIRFQELDRTGKITREVCKKKNCGLEEDPFLLESVSLFARFELALIRHDVDLASGIKQRMAQIGQKQDLSSHPDRVKNLKACLEKRGFSQSKLDGFDKTFQRLLRERGEQIV